MAQDLLKEMNIWGNGVSEISIVAPLKKEVISAIHLPYSHQEIIFKEVTSFSLTSISAIFKALLIFIVMFAFVAILNKHKI